MGTDIVVHPVGINNCADVNAWALIERSLVLAKKGSLAVEAARASGNKKNYFYYSRRVYVKLACCYC
jgi:hypothetical protein